MPSQSVSSPLGLPGLQPGLADAMQLEQAVEAYRAVEQTSPHFDHALFELTWTYIRMGDAIQAERALEVLSVAAPDSPLNADGKILRGDLLARVGRYDEAEIVFDEPQRAVAPGQAAVAYDGDLVLGGGWIEPSREFEGASA